MKRKSPLSLLAGVVLSAVFSTELAAQEGNDTFPQGPESTLHASPACIIDAMRKTLGDAADIDSSTLPSGVITAVNISEDFYRLVEVYVAGQDTVTSLSATIRDGATWDHPWGTGTITYESMTGIQGFSLQRLDPSKMAEIITNLDANIRHCNPASSLALS